MPRRKKRPSPAIGTIRKREHKGEIYVMEVVELAGEIRYKVNDVAYRSPSGAAKSITGNEVNGWQFWRLDS